MTVETEELPVAPVWRIVVVVVVLMMDCELAQLPAFKFASAVRTNPRQYFECSITIGLLQVNSCALCHMSLEEDGNPLVPHSTPSLEIKPTRGREWLLVSCGWRRGFTVKDCFFVLEVVKTWIDLSRKQPRTMHHLGRGTFMVAGKMMKLLSKAR